MQIFPSGGGRPDAATSDGHTSLYLFATREPVKAKYTLSLHAARPMLPSTTATPTATPTTPPALDGVRIEDTASGSTTASHILTDSNAEEESKVHYICNGTTKNFASSSEGWGFLKFFPRKQFLIGQWSTRDEIRIEAFVSVVTGIHHTADARAPGGLHLSSSRGLQQDLAHMFATKNSGDIEFYVSPGTRNDTSSTIVRAHSFILCARSQYFRVPFFFFCVFCFFVFFLGGFVCFFFFFY